MPSLFVLSHSILVVFWLLVNKRFSSLIFALTVIRWRLRQASRSTTTAVIIQLMLLLWMQPAFPYFLSLLELNLTTPTNNKNKHLIPFDNFWIIVWCLSRALTLHIIKLESKRKSDNRSYFSGVAWFYYRTQSISIFGYVTKTYLAHLFVYVNLLERIHFNCHQTALGNRKLIRSIASCYSMSLIHVAIESTSDFANWSQLFLKKSMHKQVHSVGTENWQNKTEKGIR